MSKRKPEHRADVVVPAGQSHVAIGIFVKRVDELERVRIQGISGWLIQQKGLDTVFVRPRRRSSRKPTP